MLRSLESRSSPHRSALALRLAVVLSGGVVLAATQPSAPAIDAAFSRFFSARTTEEARAAVDRIVVAGVGFDEVFRRLRQGRVYSRDVPRGVVQGSRRSDTGEYFYTLDVPEG